MTASRLRIAVALTAVLSVASLIAHAALLRPRQWPAGGGFTLSGDVVMASLAEPRRQLHVWPPDLRAAAGTPIVVRQVRTDGAAGRAGAAVGDRVVAVSDAAGHRVELGEGVPVDRAAALRVWREAYHLAPTGPLTLDLVRTSGEPARIVVPRPAVWSLDDETRLAWLEGYHFAPLAKLVAYTLTALLLIALGARGTSAHLMTLAFFFMGASDSSLLFGADLVMPVVGPVVLLFNWLCPALAFPAVGFAVLHFPTRAPVLDRYRWLGPTLWGVSIPLGAVGLASAGYLLGADATEPLVAWAAARPWFFNACVSIGLAMNMAVVAEGVHRYRINPDAQERRRIETVVFTAVPGAVAYVISSGVPLAAELFGKTVPLPWALALGLQLIVLGSAAGMAYAVAVRRALAPRAVLRRGMQYALAKRTLQLLVLLPFVLLDIALVRQRDRSLSAIVSGRPLFYVSSIALLAIGLRYRERAERWLDRRFFRTEYDAREILLSLAARLPFEADPRDGVAMVVTEVDTALHPESLTVLADGGSSLVPVASVRSHASALDGESALVTLLRWSDRPLEVLLSDEDSQVGRLPAADRAWLGEAGASLLVPLFGGGQPRPLVGLLVLGRKQSEEPYSSEDRRLLTGIATQMGVALDLSRLRQRVAAKEGSDANIGSSTPTTLPGRSSSGGVGEGMVIDGKYRVGTLIGRGGMGAVYRATDVRLEREVAIKVVRAELLSAPDARVRFRREAQIVARLQHPAVVTIFDYGSLPEGDAYLVMELVRGEDLRERMRRGGRLPASEVSRVVGRIAAGVEAAHQAGVLHRDLKPENVLLADSGEVKVLDFGVAKIHVPDGQPGRTLTGVGTIVGTPAYMAPEQLRGEAVDGRADVFSLGVMTYEALTGTLPYGAGSFIDVAMRQLQADDAVNMELVPVGMRDAILGAISVDRDKRPASPAAFAAGLDGR